MQNVDIKRLRTDLGLSQSEFAEKLGVKRLAVARWESGTRKPDKENQERLIKFAKENELDTKVVSSEQEIVSTNDELDTKVVSDVDTKSEIVSSKSEIVSSEVDTLDTTLDTNSQVDTQNVSDVDTKSEIVSSKSEIVSSEVDTLDTTLDTNSQVDTQNVSDVDTKLDTKADTKEDISQKADTSNENVDDETASQEPGATGHENVTTIDYDSIPTELKELDQWVCWNTEVRDGRPTKPPRMTTGKMADSTDPATWASFENAKEAYEGGKFEGIGFVFSADDPYTGVDLDKCRAGKIQGWADNWIQKLNSYTEISPSREGVHVIVKGKKKGDAARKDKIEIYDTARYFTITGNVLDGYTTIESRQTELDALYDAIFTKEEKQSAPAKAVTVSLSDEELIEKAKNAKNGNGAKFTALWQGEITGYESQSEADLALCSLLAFWTGKDSDRIDKLFRQSGLYREKWDREDYRGLTIDTAIESVTAVYEPTEPKTVTKQAASKEKEDEPSAGEIALKFLHTYFIADGIYILRYYREDWSEWNGKCYQELSTQDLRARIARFVDDETKRKVSKSFVASVMEALTGRCMVPADAVQPVWVGNRFQAKKAGHVLAFENGWLNFDAFLKGEGAEVKPHMPALFTQVALPYDFDPNAECPKWQEFLDHNMERDADRIAILQEFTGYCFTWDTTLHKFLLMEGEAGTGKSTFTDVINALLGESNVSHVPLEAFGQRFSLYPTLGKIANIASEIGELDSVAEGQLKAFVAGDPMQFERKYRDTVQAKPTARLILATNNRPRFVDRTDGIWRRLILVPWNVVVSDEKRIYGLGEQIIREDLAGVFNWAIAGLKRLREQGRFTESEIVQVAINEYKLESNPAKAFLRENYDEGNGEAKVHEVYNNYKDFCEECGYRPLNMSNFGREVRRLFPHIMKVRRQNNGLRYQVYAGIFEV